MDVLRTWLGLVESPRWHESRLWFSDWIAGEIIAIDDDGLFELIVRHESLPLCFDFLPAGRPGLVSNQQLALLTLEDDGALATYADLSALSSFGFNDIVVDGHGNAYVNSGNFEFTDGPPAGPVPTRLRCPRDTQWHRPDSRAGHRVSQRHGRHRGQPHAGVADSYRHRLLGFDIGADGSLSGHRVWADLGDATPDGICLDAEGAAWYADVPRQYCVRVAEGGQRLATVPLDRGGFACSAGPMDRAFTWSPPGGLAWPGSAGTRPGRVKCCALRSLSQARGGPPAEGTSAAVRWLAPSVAVRLPSRGLQALHGSVR